MGKIRVAAAVAAVVLIAAACGESDTEATVTDAGSTTAAAAAATTTTSPQTVVTTSTTLPATTLPTTTTLPPGGLTFDFSVVRGLENPALDDGEVGEWDSRFSFGPWVVHDGEIFHLFYTGWGGDEIAIGYATSTDGLTFDEYPDNPIVNLPTAAEGREAGRAIVRTLDDGTWEMFIGEWVDRKTQGSAIWRATSPNPTGPWAVESAPVFESVSGDWHSRLVPQGFIPGGGIYYDGVRLSSIQTGALLPDGDGGLAPYDDLATTGSAFDASDPIFGPSDEPNAWDQANVSSPIVFTTGDGLEMFYQGYHQAKTKSKEKWGWLGYATSADGLTWDRHEVNPVIEITNENGWLWMSGVKVDDTYFLYYAIKAGSDGIGVIQGSISSGG